MTFAVLALAAALSAPVRVYPVTEIVDVYDGDTATIVVDLGLDIRVVKTIRVFGIDTPEVRPLATREAGHRSRDWLDDRLRACPDLTIITGTRNGRPEVGKYGRLLGTFVCEGVDLTQEMIERGLGVPYSGGTK